VPDPVTRLKDALESRYSIEGELGEGGMATVYLAKDLKHNRSVALKVLKPELAAVVGAERFLAEIETTANLQHPNILPLYDSGEADSFLYYVMPYVEGETLRERLETEKQLPVDEAVRIATAVANALNFAHEHGVVHRDIKPANILFQGGQPVVGDFGIALAVGAGGGARLTETGLSVGTPYYMSPEQATGDQQVGARSDIYSLGCVLYEMLVGSDHQWQADLHHGEALRGAGPCGRVDPQGTREGPGGPVRYGR
jgi:serine/threonine-protein kinase